MNEKTTWQNLIENYGNDAYKDENYKFAVFDEETYEVFMAGFVQETLEEDIRNGFVVFEEHNKPVFLDIENDKIIHPKIIYVCTTGGREMNNKLEMTLSEWVYTLTETHQARREYEELLAENRRLREALKEREIQIDYDIDCRHPKGVHPKWDELNNDEKASNPPELTEFRRDTIPGEGVDFEPLDSHLPKRHTIPGEGVDFEPLDSHLPKR